MLFKNLRHIHFEMKIGLSFKAKKFTLGTHLFVKVPRPGDREVTFTVFESSCHLLLPV